MDGDAPPPPRDVVPLVGAKRRAEGEDAEERAQKKAVIKQVYQEEAKKTKSITLTRASLPAAGQGAQHGGPMKPGAAAALPSLEELAAAPRYGLNARELILSAVAGLASAGEASNPAKAMHAGSVMLVPGCVAVSSHPWPAITCKVAPSNNCCRWPWRPQHNHQQQRQHGQGSRSASSRCGASARKRACCKGPSCTPSSGPARACPSRCKTNSYPRSTTGSKICRRACRIGAGQQGQRPRSTR